MHQFCKFSYLQRMRPIEGALLRDGISKKKKSRKSRDFKFAFYCGGISTMENYSLMKLPRSKISCKSFPGLHTRRQGFYAWVCTHPFFLPKSSIFNSSDHAPPPMPPLDHPDGPWTCVVVRRELGARCRILNHEEVLFL